MTSLATRSDRLAGVLLGTALGDALGLPAEGMSAPAIARRFGRMDRFRLLGSTGFVSDDTEQAALVAQSLARHPDDPKACVRAFRRSLFGWFCRLPWGVGLATVRACTRIALGIEPSGVMSAGNGAAMRSAVIGVFLHDRPDSRRALCRALAEVTHRDPRAVEGALYVAELAAACARSTPGLSRRGMVDEARGIIRDAELGSSLDRAVEMERAGVSLRKAAETIGTTGYVVSTVAFASFCFLRHGHEPLTCLVEAIAAGGDTDTIGAILGSWLGALHGESRLPAGLISRIHDGPFGPTHLRALAACLVGVSDGVAGYSAARAMARNLLLCPVIIGHGFRRLVPF